MVPARCMPIQNARIEPLEARIAPATVIALSDSDTLLRFNDATPGSVVTTTITGLGGGEDLVGIDFRPANGLLYGLTIDGTNASRLYTISPVTGIATLVASLSAALGDDDPYTTLNGTSFGFDFNPVADRLRVVSDADINLSINPADAVVTTQTALNPGTPNVVGAAYTNSFPGATSTVLYALDSDADTLATIAPPASGTLAPAGSGLGVDASGVLGFDIGHGKGEALAALTVGGTTGLYRIDLTSGGATNLGSIGTGAVNLRGLAIVTHLWDGDGGNTQVTNSANWVAGLAPVAGDSLIFPTGPANKTVFNNLPNLAALNAIRFTGDGYAISSNNVLRLLDGIFVTHTTGTTNFTQGLVFGALNGASPTIDVTAGATLNLSQANIDGTQGVNFTGGGVIDLFSLNAGAAGTNLVIDGPSVTIDFLNSQRPVAIQGGTLTVGKVGGQTNFAPVTLTGGTLAGGGDVAAVTLIGGTVEIDDTGIVVNGAFNLGAAGTAKFVLPAAPLVFDPLEVKGTVTLAGALDLSAAASSAPPSITLITNDGADAVSGTFAGLAEGAAVSLLGRDYMLSYAGGDGNDVTLTGVSAPINIVAGGKSATFIDVDGDLVTVAITKGDLNDVVFSLRNAGGGRAQLELLDFRGDTTFAGTNLTFTAKRQGIDGDGNVNVGYINATNLDLGAVKLPGDLAAIDAGDATPGTLALKSLAVHSLGVFGVTTGSPDLESDLDGRVGSIVIRGDVREAIIDVFDRTKDTGNQGSGSSGDGEAFINSLTIGGHLIGGAGTASGSILVRDGIVKATIGGSIIGGSGLASGQISSFDSLGKFTIHGSIIGGSGLSSGKINATTDGIESLAVLGDLVGGTGADSGAIDISDFDGERPTGSFLLGGSVIGGAGSGTAQIDFAGPVKKATIGGDILGGAGQFSSLVNFEETGGSFLLGGSVIAGAGDFSALLNFEESLGNLTILGAIIGQESTFAAQVEVDDDLGKLTLGGSVIGGGQFSGTLDVGKLKSGTIRGSIVGGAGAFGGTLTTTGLGSLTVGSILGGAGSDSGALSVLGGTVGKLKVLGSVTGGGGDRSGAITMTGTTVSSAEIIGSILSGTGATSGSVRVGGAFGALKVGGEIRGTADDPVTITGGGTVSGPDASAIGIGSLTVAGGVTHARILAGYDAGGVGRNADAQIGKVSVGGDWIASSLVAGLFAGADTLFGTNDDAIISGGGTTNNVDVASRIGSVAIKGQVLGTPAAGGGFGLVAEEIGALTAGPVKFALTANDDVFILGATGDFQARELAAADPADGPAGPTATLVNDQTVTFTDVDGDLVTVKVSAGTLDLLTNFVFAAHGVGQQLQRLVLTDAEFSGANITITAQRSASGGDGSVNVGYVNAAGFDLGKVIIAGDLGAIDASDNDSSNVGLAELSVQSLGVFGTTTGAPDLISNLDGRVPALKIRGDLRDATFLVADSLLNGNGTIGALTIGGSLIGGAAANSGLVSTANDLLKVTINGNVIGGTNTQTGVLEAHRDFGSVALRGSLLGGAGPQSGRMVTDGGEAATIAIGGDIIGGAGAGGARVLVQGNIGKVTLGGSLLGGSTAASGGIVSFGTALGSVSVGGDVIGGAGLQSAIINSSLGTLGKLEVRGSVIGAGGDESANLQAGTGLGAMSIGGAIVGGAGLNSGAIESGTGGLNSLKLGGSLLGYRGATVGAGEASGLIETIALGSATIGGSIYGGISENAGQLLTTGSMGKVAVGGSVVGGAGGFSGSIFSEGTAAQIRIGRNVFGGAGEQAGNIEVNDRLSDLSIGGSVFSGSGELSGALMSDDDILKITIGGSLIGTAARPVIISGEDSATPSIDSDVALGKITIKGGVQFAQIRAGYDDLSAEEPGVSIGSIEVGGDWLASSIGAAVDAGGDGDFGTLDDFLIPGGGPVARIASILVKGQLAGTPGGTDAFGFVAEQIGKLKIGAISYALTSAPDEIITLGATGDFFAREDV